MKTSLVKNHFGFTVLEVLVAAVLAAIVTAAGFNFYTTLNNSTSTQQDISDLQVVCRNSLDEISRTLRKAGFKLSGHKKFAVVGDSLKVFYSETKAVDTVNYYLQELDDTEYLRVVGRPKTLKFYKLMKRVNSEAASDFAYNLKSINYQVIDSATLAITLTVLAGREDEDFKPNNGFREFSNTQRVHMRNMTL